MAIPDRGLVFPEMKPNPRISAVLILLFLENDVLHFPLILRPTYDGVHSAQMAFPGGGREEQDKDLVDTALRESQEEIGFSTDRIKVLGQLSDFYIPPSHSLVSPIVAYTDQRPTYDIDTYEVDRVIETNLEVVRNPENLSHKQITLQNGYKMKAPAFMVDGQTVWGATAMILSEFLMVLEEVEI
jgi:8-oxo-dGTP pyrophosphatase MutT (NUDIX family)